MSSRPHALEASTRARYPRASVDRRVADSIESNEPILSLELLCALSYLDADEREVIVEHHVRGRTWTAIAEEKKLTRGALERLKRRAYKALRLALGDRDAL